MQNTREQLAGGQAEEIALTRQQPPQAYVARNPDGLEDQMKVPSYGDVEDSSQMAPPSQSIMAPRQQQSDKACGPEDKAQRKSRQGQAEADGHAGSKKTNQSQMNNTLRTLPDPSIFANPKLNKLHQRKGDGFHDAALDGHPAQLPNAGMAQAKSRQQQRQYGTNPRAYDEFNEVRDYRYNQEAHRAQRLLQNRMSVLTPTAFQTIRQSPSPQVLLEKDFQILGVSALKTSKQKSVLDKPEQIKTMGTKTQAFMHARGNAQIQDTNTSRRDSGQLHSITDLHDGVHTSQNFRSKYNPVSGGSSATRNQGQHHQTQAARQSPEKARTQHQKSRKDGLKNPSSKRNEQIFVYNSQDVSSKHGGQVFSQNQARPTLIGQLNKTTEANSGGYQMSNSSAKNSHFQNQPYAVTINSQFPSSRYENVQAKHQFKLLKDNLTDHLGTQRDFRNQMNLLTDQDLEKICYLSGVDSFRTESEINHIFHKSQRQSQDPKSSYQNRMFSPKLSQPGNQVAMAELLSPLSKAQTRAKIKSVNGGPRQAIKMPKFLAKHMVEKKIFTQQFMNTQRNEAPDFDQISLLSMNLQQFQKKQEEERQQLLKKQIEHLGQSTSHQQPDFESSRITTKQKASLRRSQHSPTRGPQKVKKESKSLNATRLQNQPDDSIRKDKKANRAEKETIGAKEIHHKLTNSINLEDEQRKYLQGEDIKEDLDISKLRKSVQQEGSFHIADLLDSTGSREKGKSALGESYNNNTLQKLDGGLSGLSSNRMTDQIKQMISMNNIQDVLSACNSYNQIKHEITQMPDYTQRGFLELEPDEEFVITNYRLIKRKTNQNEQQQRQSPERRAIQSAQQAELLGNANQQSLNNTIANPTSPGIEQVPASLQQQPSWSSKVAVSNSLIGTRRTDDAIRAEKASRLNWDKVASLPIQDVNQNNFISTLDGPQEEEVITNYSPTSRDYRQLVTVMEDPDTAEDQAAAQRTADGAPAMAGNQIQQRYSTEHQLSSNLPSRLFDKLATTSFRNKAREVFLSCLDVWLEGQAGGDHKGLLQGILSDDFLSDSYFDRKPKEESSISFEKTNFNSAGKAKAAWKRKADAQNSSRITQPNMTTENKNDVQVNKAGHSSINEPAGLATSRHLPEHASQQNPPSPGSNARSKQENRTVTLTAEEAGGINYSIYSDFQEAQQPYDHLKADVVYKDDSLQYHHKMKSLESIQDRFQRISSMIELSKTFLTALDKKKNIAELMPFELFIEDYQSETKWISEQIQINKQKGLKPLKAHSFFYHLDGRVEKMEVDVLDYDANIAKFYVQYIMPKSCVSSSPNRQGEAGNVIKKQSGRLNLQFLDFETEAEIKKRFMNAQNRRKAALLLLVEERIILNDLIYLYRDLEIPLQIKMKMRNLVNDRINLKRYPKQELVHDLVMQVEAAYVYYILKSTIRSQIQDPLIQSCMRKYDLKTLKPPVVDNDGTSFLKYVMPTYSIERREDFHTSRRMIEADSVTGNKDLLNVIKTVMDQTHFVIRSNPLFELPSSLKDETIGYLLSQKAFARNTKQAFREKLVQFPVQISYIHQVQNSLAKRFKNQLHNKWLELIVQKIENMISSAADARISSASTKPESKKIIKRKSQIEPFLMKFFTFINIYMERMLFDKMKESMEKFLKFLLQFMARQSAFSQQSAFKTFGLDAVMYSCEHAPMSKIKVQVQKKQAAKQVNYESTATRIEDQGATSKTASDIENRYEISTVPEINESWRMLQDVMTEFQGALSGVKKVENIIFPLLETPKPFLDEPDAEKIADLKILNGQIKWLMSQAQAQPMAILKDLSKYLKYVSITENEMIRNMKIQIYNKKRRRDSEAEERVDEAAQDQDIEDALLQKSASSISEDQAPEKVQRKDAHQPGQELTPEEQMESALEHLEITQDEYSDKLFELTNAYWDIQEKYQNQYDFGIILLDLETVKKQISSKIEALISKLQARAVSTFTTKMDELDQKFQFIETKLTATHYTIDDVLEQIEYIKMMFKGADIIEDLENQLEFLKSKKSFLDEESIKLPSERFTRYLNLFLQPRNLRDLIEDKFSNLSEQTKKITEMLQADVDELNGIIMTCKYQVDNFQKRGLATPAELEKVHKKKELSKDLATALSKAKKHKEPVVMDKELIKPFVDELGRLEDNSNEIFSQIDTLGKRQKQLGQKVSTFPKMQQVSKDLSPFKQMWDIAYKYSVKRTAWWTGKLSSIQSQQLQDSINSWHKQLSNLKAFSGLNEFEKPGLVLNFIFKEIDEIKSYLPIVQRLRAKGLEKRHFVEMSSLLGVNVDPTNLTMTDIKLKKLYMGDTLEAIKNVSGVAFKENSIRMAIDAIEREIREICFECIPYKDQPVKIIKNSDMVLMNLDESLIKLQAIKGNEFAKFQADRIIKIERELKFLQVNFENWTRVQKAWIYLETIYTQDDVAENLPDQKATFDDVNLKFRKIMNGNTVQFTMIQDFCRSEGFTGTAVKMIEDLEYLDKSLTDYLDKKRMQFARLYFTSNDELIGLMGNITNQAYVQVFLSKLFEGIAGLIFGEHQIVGFYSKSKEQLFFKSPISTLVPPELWLKEIEIGMKKTIYQQLHKGLKDYVARQRGEANESKRQLLDEGQAENSDTKMDQCDAMTRMEQEGRMSQPVSSDDNNQVGARSEQPPVGERNDSQEDKETLGDEKATKKKESTISEWLLKWPGQVLILAIHVMHTNNMEKMFKQRKDKRTPRAPAAYKNSKNAKKEQALTLNSIYEEVVGQLDEASQMIRQKLDANARFSIHNFVINRIHTRDSIQEMLKDQEKDSDENFYWKIQMKYHYVIHKPESTKAIGKVSATNSKTNSEQGANEDDPAPEEEAGVEQQQAVLDKQNENGDGEDDNAKQLQFSVPDPWDFDKDAQYDWLPASEYRKRGIKELTVSCMMARKQFGYEYIGNSNRLVITPLTDRCFRTMFMALHYSYGSQLEGPVGTGKTETTKELAKSLGKMCFVFTCSQSLNYESLVKFFKGFASGGSWACFDELNRIDIGVLSTLAITISTINRAHRALKQEIAFGDDDKSIKFDHSCAIFCTQNPATAKKAGRNQLPDALKDQFRPLQMTKPDLKIIIEVVLYCNGFTNSDGLALKIVQMFEFAKRQLSHQVHYDFSLRNIKSILDQAGHLRQLVTGMKEAHTQGELEQADQQMEHHLSELERKQQEHKRQQEKQNEIYMGKMKRRQSRLPSSQSYKSSNSSNSAVDQNKTMDNRALTQQTIQENDVIKEEDEMKPGSASSKSRRSGGVMANEQDGDTTQQLSALLAAIASNSMTTGQSEECAMPEDTAEGELFERCKRWLGVTQFGAVSNMKKLEKYILLKSIFDQNLSKLEENDQIVFKGIAKDIFKSAKVEIQPNAQFKEDIQRTMKLRGLEPEPDFVFSVLNLNEIINNRQGIMIIGSTMVGKTNALNVIEDTYNSQQQQEFKQKKAEFLKRRTKILAEGKVKSSTMELGLMSQETTEQKEPKDTNSISQEELQMLKATCRSKGVNKFIINPKAQPYAKLNGQTDAETRDFKEGIISTTMRMAIKHKNDKFQWMIFDGEIEIHWIENLNSVLDDNKKLTLITGESLPLVEHMRMIFEADNLKSCSPASISRCGILYMQEKVINCKAIVNHYMRKFPKFLSDLVYQFDQMANYFLPGILGHFLSEDNQQNMIYPVTPKYAVMNFLKYFEACIADYRHEKFSDWKTVQRLQEQAADKKDQNADGIPESNIQKARNLKSRQKISYFTFAESDARMTNAIRFRERWLECFFIQSLIWAFGTMLKESHRKEFMKFITKSILKNFDNVIQEAEDAKRNKMQELHAKMRREAQDGGLREASTTREPTHEDKETVKLAIDHEKFEELMEDANNTNYKNSYEPTARFVLKNEVEIVEKQKVEHEDLEEEVSDEEEEDELMQLIAEGQLETMKIKMKQSSRQTSAKVLRKQKTEIQDAGRLIQKQKYMQQSCNMSSEQFAGQNTNTFSNKAKTLDDQSYAAQKMFLDAGSGNGSKASKLAEPTFKCSFPESNIKSIFDIYFDIDICRWQTFEDMFKLQTSIVDKDVSQEEQVLHTVDSRTNLFTQFITTMETTQLSYFIESNLTFQNNLALVGESGTGKSWLLSHVVSRYTSKFPEEYIITPMVFYHRTTTTNVLKNLELPLERKRKNLYIPQDGKKLVYMIDDLNMCNQKQEYGSEQPCVLELIRQHFDHQQWFDLVSLEKRTIEDIQFTACITFNNSNSSGRSQSRSDSSSGSQLLNARNQRHWAFLGVPCSNQHLKTIFTTISGELIDSWPSMDDGLYSQKIVDCVLELRTSYHKLIRTSTNKVLLAFNVRQLFRIMHSFVLFTPEKHHKQTELDVYKLVISESFRTLIDRVQEPADRAIFNIEIAALAQKFFTVEKEELEALQKQVGRSYFSHLNISPVVMDGEYRYQEVDNVQILRPLMNNFMNEYNEQFKHSQLDISMFDFAIEQVIKLNRAIQQPFSNVVLIGVEGLGKMALARLAIYICQYQIRELKLTAEFNRDDWQVLIKAMFESTVIDKRVNVLNIQDNQIADDIIMVDLNCLLKNGDLPDLLHASEKSGFLERIRSTMPQSKLGGTAPSDSSVYTEMINRSKKNFKAIINLTPTGRTLKKELKNYQSIVNCSTIIWMDQWPEEGYKQVGKMRLTQFTDEDDAINEVKVTQEDEILRCALRMHADMQRAIKEYTKETGHFIYLTPCTFTNLIQTFKDFYRSRVQHFTALKRKFAAGLDKLDATEKKVFEIQEDMDVKSPELVEKQRRIEDILKELDDSTQEMEARIKFVEEEEMALKATQEDALRIKDQCEKAMREAIPRLKASIHSLKKLTKSELTELKSIKKPTTTIYLLLQCVCILMGVPPKKAKNKALMHKHDEDWWAAATSKEVLGNYQLVEILSNFNPERLDHDIMKQLDEVASNKEFNLLNITKACEAARGIFHWLKATENYFYVYEECKPKRDALMLAEKQIIVHQEEVKHRLGALKTLQDKLSELRDEYKNKEKDVKQLQDEIDTCGLQKTRAAKLLSALAGEKQKWYVLTNVVQKKFETLQGDCLLAAALMIYLGQFTHQYREEYVNRWFHWIRHKSSIKISEYFDFIKLFGDKVKIQKWVLNKLPSDTFSISNALMIEMNTQIQSIIIDPQYQANIWLKQNSREDDSLLTITFHNPKFLQLISASIKFGKKTLCENAGENIDKALYPLFNKSMLRTDGKSQFINLQGASEEIDSNFKLYVTTEYQTPLFQSDIAVYTNFINFTITKEGLEAQLLSVIVIEKLYAIEREFVELKTQALDCIIRLDQVEELILQALDKDILAVLNDETLIENLTQSSYTSKKIQTSLQQINRSQQALEGNRNKFQVVAKRGAQLYFLIKDLQRIEHVYQFSLKWFLELFDFELKTKENLNTAIDPLVDLNQRFTKSAYQKICVGLYQKDKLLVAFLLAITLMRQELKFDENHLKFIIKGPFATATEQMTQVEKDELELRKKISYSNPQKDKIMRNWHNWMTDKHWEGLEALAQMAPFNKPNIIDQMIKSPIEWHNFIQNQEDNPNGIIPGPYGRFTTAEEKETMRLKKVMEEQMRQQQSFNQKQQEQQQQTKNVNIEDILAADNSDSDDPQGVVKEAQFGTKNLRETQTPPLTDHSDEEEDAFLKRRNYIQEDEFVVKNIINGLPEYNEFKIGRAEEVDQEQEQLQIKVNRDIFKCCILRIFRPDLMIEQVKRLIDDVLDETFTDQEAFNFYNVLRHTDNKRATLMLVDSGINAQQELLRMKVETKQLMPLTCKALTVKNIKKLPETLTSAAQQGHWVLLDGLHLVLRHVPTIMQFLETMFFFHEDQKEKRQKDLRRKRSRIKAQEQKVVSVSAKKVFEDIEFGGAKAEENPGKSQMAEEDLDISLAMPRIDAFKIHPDFRLWISTQAMNALQISMLQECAKIIIEPMQGLKQNLSKIISSTPDTTVEEVEKVCPTFTDQHKKLFFVISFYHAIMNERQRFGALGWNKVYEFSQIDCQISQYTAISILKDLDRLEQLNYAKQQQALIEQQTYNEGAEYGNCETIMNTPSTAQIEQRKREAADRVPEALSLIKYIISSLNYGGKISNGQDQLIAHELLNTVINPKAVSTYAANLTGLTHPPECLRQYVIPDPRGTKDMFVSHVCRFPPTDRPEIFGIHFNAQQAQTEAKGLSLLSRVFAFDQTKHSKLYQLDSLDLTLDETDPGKLKRYKTKLKDVTFYTPKAICMSQLDSQFRITYKNSIAIFMHQEVEKYNNLLGFINKRVSALYKYLNGEMILDQEMEAEFFGIINDQTPTQWLAVSYPGSGVLPLYLHNLQQRIDYMNSIIDQDHSHPIHQHMSAGLSREPAEASRGNKELFKFWLPGLFDPGNFFVLILQHEARIKGLPLETMTFKYTVTAIYDDMLDKEVKPGDKVHMEKKLHRPPEAGGYYIYGMAIHGGAWNRKMKFMEDIPSHQKHLSAPFPVVHLQIIETSESQLYSNWNTSFGTISKYLEETMKIHKDKNKEVDLETEEILINVEVQNKHYDRQVAEAGKAAAASELRPVDLTSANLAQVLDLYDIKNNKYYLAPLYITGQRDMLPSETAVRGFVRHIPIRIENATSAGFWVKRNVALLCHTE